MLQQQDDRRRRRTYDKRLAMSQPSSPVDEASTHLDTRQVRISDPSNARSSEQSNFELTSRDAIK
ncbi:hypothetical protein DOTSEDRAFT_74491 [Dothistroma septosporum NZE10]|uniref:Uncharacterized protein n=1 Tax=Dothistroma septosporum (strain NZE10 / CBS 128990) TaxID=675120 RepID=N1PEA5_DOTSN|nr:hypothetical protein DOTSEDRAFT_74491 [Dothistroma septosporum NZE10]